MSTRISHRVKVDAAEVVRLRRSGVLVEDGSRQRPFWFDGRFLAARDLIREQQYFLAREADLGRAAGSGVAAGLEVRAGRGPRRLDIAPGHGITPSGELVSLERGLGIDLDDIPRAELLSARFGLGRIPNAPLRSNTGLFVLGLRPVEFTANPVGAYPTSITGQRKVEDGDIIEATAVVLVPWPDEGQADALDARRARAARAIFVDDADTRMPANVLPLAMVGLDRNTLAWVDVPMVRRELGADRSDLPGLGLAPRALRLAHLQQYQGHLADVVEATGGRGFAAAAVFPALPPAGPMPPGAIDPGDFSQRWLPPDVDVQFSIIPEDELPALVEEALALPPLDFASAEPDLATSAVLVLAPVPRHQWNRVLATLENTTRPLRPAAANLIATRKPLEVLQRLRLPLPALPPANPQSPSDAEWQRLARLPTLWYVRRRNLAWRDDLAGTALRLAGRQDRDEDLVRARVRDLGLEAELDAVLVRATPVARLEIANLLASPRLEASPALTAVAIGELARAETLDHVGALRATDAVTAPEAGSGLARLESSVETIAAPEALRRLVVDADWQRLDREARVAERSVLSTLGVRALTPIR